MIFDTDILSMLGKIGRTDLLRELFPETRRSSLQLDLLEHIKLYNKKIKISNKSCGEG